MSEFFLIILCATLRVGLATALPPDVRHGSALPYGGLLALGYALVRLCPQTVSKAKGVGAKPEPGAKSKPKERLNGKAEPCLTSGGKAVPNAAQK